MWKRDADFFFHNSVISTEQVSYLLYIMLMESAWETKKSIGFLQYILVNKGYVPDYI